MAVALIPGSTNRLGAAGALILLGAFSLAVAVNLARGRTPDCHCFGQVHSRPIGAGTLVRPFGGDVNPSKDCKCAPNAKEGDGCIEARPHCGSSDNPC